MPEFPRYQSKANITNQPQSVLAPEDTSAQVTSQMAKMGADVAGAAAKISEINTKYEEAMKLTRKTVASVNSADEISSIQQEAEVDPDPNNLKIYQEKLNKSKSKQLEGLDPISQLQISHDYNVANFQMQNQFKKKGIELNTIAVDRKIQQMVNNPTDASFPEIQSLLKQNVEKGLMDPSVAYAKETKANADLGVNRISQALYQAKTPEEVDAVTAGITSGAYEKGGVTIEPDKKKNLLDIAKSARSSAQKAEAAREQEAMAQNRVQTLANVASGKAPLEELDIAEISEYDPQLASTLTKVKNFMGNYNPQLPANEQPLSTAGLTTVTQAAAMKDYARTITDTFMQSDNKNLSEFMMRELQKKGDGLTSGVKLAAFANLASLKAQANNPQTPQHAEASEVLNSIKAGVNFLKTANPMYSASMIGDFVVKNYLSGANTPEKIMKEAKSVLKDRLIEMDARLAKLKYSPNKIVDGDAPVQDLHAGVNELKEGQYGSYQDDSD